MRIIYYKYFCSILPNSQLAEKLIQGTPLNDFALSGLKFSSNTPLLHYSS